MNERGLSKQIIFIAILPALLVGIFLSLFYTFEDLNAITQKQEQHGEFIVEQLAPITRHSLLRYDFVTLKALIEELADSEDVSFVKVRDADDNLLLDVENTYEYGQENIIHRLLQGSATTSFSTPVFQEYDLLGGARYKQVIAHIEVGLNTHRVTTEKAERIIRGASITFAILLLSSIIIFRIGHRITIPIQKLTDSVRKITAGDLDSSVPQDSTGELGVLETCIKQMRDELRVSRADMQEQLDSYTNELQETMEELEVRNAELDITRSKAIYANNAKSEFLANMSHEIRTPLSGIIGFTELLQDTRLSTQQQDYASTIQKSARTLLEIINDILDLSKIESGKTEISATEFVLVDIIEDIINLLSPTALDKNIELFYRIDHDVNATIKADPFRLHQILTNLIGNAIKFTEKGYVYLQVTRGELSDVGENIKFTISDTGIGMTSDDKNKLFNAFTQADINITRRFGGTGLGLVISRKLTQLMDGEIGFDSTYGEGSTFWFSIPVDILPAEDAPSALRDIRIAFLCNHFIATQSFRTIFESFQCQLDHYSLDMLDDIDAIHEDSDLIVAFLSRKEINSKPLLKSLAAVKMSKPSLLIASTRSHKELRDLQMHVFDNATFSTEKIERLRLKLINTLHRKAEPIEIDEETTADILAHDWADISVMVVDDNEINLKLAQIILHKRKARVTTASSGRQAIDYASMNSFDIIFMDLHMPGIDGYETARTIREITPGRQPVIIALTANALPSEKEKVVNSDMNGIIIKPVSDAILHKVIAQWVLKGESATDNYTIDDDTHSDDKDDHQDDVVFSLPLAKEFTGSNEELALELFSMLRSELDDYKILIKQAAADKDMSALRDQVHKLLGASRCCGTIELRDICSRFEGLIDNNIEFDVGVETRHLMDAIQRVANYRLDNTHKASTESVTDVRPA